MDILLVVNKQVIIREKKTPSEEYLKEDHDRKLAKYQELLEQDGNQG